MPLRVILGKDVAGRFHLLVKPTGASCNLDCKYCFFLSKEELYPGSKLRMPPQTLRAYLSQLLAAQPGGEVNIAWQGGEPTLMGLEFFRRSIELVDRYRRPDQAVLHTIQTNGILVDDEWARFFKEHNFLVGLSIDGPQAMHDAYRVNKGGRGTFEQVVRAWEVLRRHDVEVNVMCAVHAANGNSPAEVYRFLRDGLGARYLQFIPIVERATAATMALANQGWSERSGGRRPLYRQEGQLVTDRSVGPQQYGAFLIGVFDQWIRSDVGGVFVQAFDAALASRLGQPSLCIFSPTCGNALALEHNGDLYCCDHYVEPAFRLGNILEQPLAQLAALDKQRAFGQSKYDSLPKYCRQCQFLSSCYGECPRNRFLLTPDGEPGLNYLCTGYQMFFRHVERPMSLMADLLRRGRYADEVMQLLNLAKSVTIE